MTPSEIKFEQVENQKVRCPTNPLFGIYWVKICEFQTNICHNKSEILLKVVLNTITITKQIS